MTTIKVEFRNKTIYQGLHLEIRRVGSQIRFYEVGKKEYCLKRETVTYLVHAGSIPRLKTVKLALKGDKSIFN